MVPLSGGGPHLERAAAAVSLIPDRAVGLTDGVADSRRGLRVPPGVVASSNPKVKERKRGEGK
jgi:hypothetical protein